ncbi:MAG TPA: protein kinase, partial [Acidothermaceae bacterium]|nr:protein kinase [Acidothermaceae bacterium]
ELRRCIAAFRALSQVHAANIVHRALGPDTTYIAESQSGPGVIFTNFFAARHGTHTIAGLLDERLTDDPYAAPEIGVMGSYAFATADSDTFTLALIFLERLAGKLVTQLRGSDGTITVPEPSEAWPYLPQATAQRVASVLSQALAAGPMAPVGSAESQRLPASECAAQLEEVWRQWDTDTAIDSNRLLDGRYRVERIVGLGASARTFLAEDTVADGWFALKQLLRPMHRGAFSEALREFQILRQYPHLNLPRVYDVYPPNHDVHVKLEFVDGPRLSDELPIYRANLVRWRQLANGLLDAVEHLEQHHLLHRDIKPDNIILRGDTGRPILIDYGAATPVGEAVDLAGTPGYLPPDAYLGTQPPDSTDRYSVGVVLFLALTGRKPFEDDTIEQRPISDLSWLPNDVRPYARTLLRAVDRDPTRRFVSTAEMRAALLAPPRENVTRGTLTDRVNPWVDELRGLFRNSRLGNADNRGLDTDFAKTTYVPTALDTELLPAILERTPRAVFLTGNPGDGKTAFLARVEDELHKRGAIAAEPDDSGWSYELGNHRFRACYDASEAHRGQNADEQLIEKLNGLQGEDRPASSVTVLVAINDGRLADIIERYEDFVWLMREVDRARRDAQALDTEDVWLIDLKRRSYVDAAPSTGDHSVMRRMLSTFVDSARWDPICDECASHDI